MIERVDVVVIGAGVVGLAVARAMALAGREPVLIERHGAPGQETSSRNSGVVHSGIYYPAGSLKAGLCVRGRESLYAYCRDRGIAHNCCGKLIVAQREQVSELERLRSRGIANGVANLARLDASDVRELEPEVHCAAALLSPSTGVVDVHELMTSFLGDTEARGGALALHTAVERIRPVDGELELELSCGSEASTIRARSVIASAGLSAVDLAKRIAGYPAEAIPSGYLAKGTYFSCSARPFRRLVYPMPSEAGLGIHATLDLDGSVRFGPDVEWVDRIDYDVNERRAQVFYDSIREYWPGLRDGALQPAYAGMRPKIVGPGQNAADFHIVGPDAHGIPGLVNLLGIESPGLTAAMAIGEHVAAMI